LKGAPSLPFNTANSSPQPPPAVTDDALDAQLAKLNPPRKYYQNYQRTRGANDDMLHAPQGLHAFFRAYYFYKSADYKGNNPHPLKARTAAEMAQIPTNYVMEKTRAWLRPVAPFHCHRGITSRIAMADRTRGGCVRDRIRQNRLHRRAPGLSRPAPAPTQEASPRCIPSRAGTIDVPSNSSRGKAIGECIKRRALSDKMRTSACTHMSGFIFSTAPEHWGCKQEQPEQASALLIQFLRDYIKL